MKTFTWIAAVLIMINYSGAYAQANAKVSTAVTEVKVKSPNAPVAKFDKTVIDFGDLKQGSPETATFTLTNEGKEPLVIATAKASCGCTNLTYAKDPILPGKSTAISVTYNAAAAGSFLKTVTVTTNADEQPVVLQIKGVVQPKKE
ncbi:MAG: DUF1573 domain-containing protein [Bacteroidales bacterium]|nr:DUF1573 domain-containing protein [Bacteroidales bacterium]MBK9357986.1 DUF1573 domain-containing protein [Bacteroidales bacterium]